MNNNAQEVRFDEEFKDDFDFGLSVKEKSQKEIIKLKQNLKNLLKIFY